MIFNITKASDWGYKDTKEFNSIEEIRDFVKNENVERYYAPACVLFFNEDKEPELLIYDTWIE